MLFSALAFNTDDAKDAVVICSVSLIDALSVKPLSNAATDCSAKLTASGNARLKATSFCSKSDSGAVSDTSLLNAAKRLSASEAESLNARL